MLRFSLADSPPQPAVGERCVHRQFHRAACRACLDACPSAAIIKDSQGMRINDEQCVRCGRCVFVCPVEAIQNIDLPRRNYRAQLLVAPFSPVAPDPSELLRWHVRYLIRGVEMTPEEHPLWMMAVAALNLILTALGETLWQIYPPRTAAVKKGLRRLFSAGQAINSSASASASASVSLDRDDLRQAFPDFTMFTLRLDTEQCLLCGACARACPQQALVMSAQQFSLDAARCSGCGICPAVCPADAILLIPGIRRAEKEVHETLQSRCSGCSRYFSHWQTSQSHCPICRQHRHGMR